MYDMPMEYHSTADHYSPWDLLPAPLPATTNYPTSYFYHNVAKHLIPDFVRIMHNGLHIDLNRVSELEDTLNEILTKVETELANNPLIQQFQLLQHSRIVAEYIEERKSKLKPIEYFLKPFKYKDMTHRSYFMHVYSLAHNITPPTETLEGSTIPKWEAKLVKRLSLTRPLLVRLLNGELTDTNPIVSEAMLLLATHKQTLHNRRYEEQIESPDIEVPPFNPASPDQKRALFEWLDIPSEATSKDSGLPSWDRDQIERVNKETTDDNVRHFTQCFIDHSFAAIVRNNFIKAFYNFTVNNRLHGSIKLFGAKSFRPTSSDP